MYVEGNSYRSIARILKVNPQSVLNWVSPFVGKKKNEIYVFAVVDQDTRCLLSWDVVVEITTDALQACLERASQARQYYI